MQNVNMPMAVSPLVTGHPLGLPNARQAPPEAQVQPANRRAETDVAPRQHQQPAPVPSGKGGDPDPTNHIAPPSIMQMKIAQMISAHGTESSAPVEEAADRTTGKTDTVTRHDDDHFAAPETGHRETSHSGADRTTHLHEDEMATAKALPAYEESVNLSRNADLSTLP